MEIRKETSDSDNFGDEVLPMTGLFESVSSLICDNPRFRQMEKSRHCRASP